jgi:hypothetical protein
MSADRLSIARVRRVAWWTSLNQLARGVAVLAGTLERLSR